jgi:hypothetical protein
MSMWRSCPGEGINPTQYYGWKKQLLSSATKIFENGRKPKRPSEDARKEAMCRQLATGQQSKNLAGGRQHPLEWPCNLGTASTARGTAKGFCPERFLLASV